MYSTLDIQILRQIRTELIQARFPDSWMEETLSMLQYQQIADLNGDGMAKVSIAANYSPALGGLLQPSAPPMPRQQTAHYDWPRLPGSGY